MTENERMDELMGRALREVDVPPPPPREEMWARIQAQRSAQRNGRAPQVLELKPRRRTTWVPWSAAIAATLVLGIGLGRITSHRPLDSVPAPIGASAPEPGVPTAYRLAATQHLQRTETLLTSLAVDGRGGTVEMASWARDLLTDTRLLLSSPAAEDAATRRLLEDLELVLSQIATIPSARAEEEVELIQDGINQSDVLLRLRAATAGPALVGT
jgi:hypothetical protein